MMSDARTPARVCPGLVMPMSGDNVYYLRRLHSFHPSNNEFRRILALLFGTYKLLPVYVLYYSYTYILVCVRSWECLEIRS